MDQLCPEDGTFYVQWDVMGLEAGKVGKGQVGLSLCRFFLWGLQGWNLGVSYRERVG